MAGLQCVIVVFPDKIHFKNIHPGVTNETSRLGYLSNINYDDYCVFLSLLVICDHSLYTVNSENLPKLPKCSAVY